MALSCESPPELSGTIPQEPVSEDLTPMPVQVIEPEPIQAAEVPVEVSHPKEEAREVVFDPHSISTETYNAAMADIQTLIADLNRIIRARNYDAWADHLDGSYYSVISSNVFLEERTEELFRRDQIVAQNMGRDPRLVEKKILRTARDYFNNVVVPSRSNDRLDDIDFVSEHKVKAYTIDTRGNKLILYDLEEIGGKWKIVN